jgi:hypothetical protein
MFIAFIYETDDNRAPGVASTSNSDGISISESFVPKFQTLLGRVGAKAKWIRINLSFN